jgi:hypothetical protein
MKTKAFASLFALFVLMGATARVASGQTASGTYQFSLEDGLTRYVEFDARSLSDGNATGQLFLSDEGEVSYQDVDGTGEQEESHKGFYLKAEFDGMVVEKNLAVMSGTIRDASIRSLIGQRVLLTVEDNGDNTRIPDRLTWGVYRPLERGWTPSDAEWKEDPGVGLRWWATDAEVKGDVGYAMPRDETVTSSSFSTSAYAFIDVERWAGDIRVLP